MGIFDDLFGKSESELERENRMLKKKLAERTSSKPKPQRKVLYQCRYCGLKFIRNISDGAPIVSANCPRHPKGWCKGLHSWQRSFL